MTKIKAGESEPIIKTVPLSFTVYGEKTKDLTFKLPIDLIEVFKTYLTLSVAGYDGKAFFDYVRLERKKNNNARIREIKRKYAKRKGLNYHLLKSVITARDIIAYAGNTELVNHFHNFFFNNENMEFKTLQSMYDVLLELNIIKDTDENREQLIIR